MLKLCRVTKVKVFFLLLVYDFNFDLFEFSAAILEKGLLEEFVLSFISTEVNKPTNISSTPKVWCRFSEVSCDFKKMSGLVAAFGTGNL